MAYDPSDDQNPLKYVSDAVLGRSQAKAPVKPQTYAGYNRAPMAEAPRFPFQDVAENAQAILGPLAGQLREAVSPLAHQEPVNLSRMYHHMRQATGAEPPPQPTHPNPALPPGYTGYGLENLDRDEARQEAARERSYRTEYAKPEDFERQRAGIDLEALSAQRAQEIINEQNAIKAANDKQAAERAAWETKNRANKDIISKGIIAPLVKHEGPGANTKSSAMGPGGIEDGTFEGNLHNSYAKHTDFPGRADLEQRIQKIDPRALDLLKKYGLVDIERPYDLDKKGKKIPKPPQEIADQKRLMDVIRNVRRPSDPKELANVMADQAGMMEPMIKEEMQTVKNLKKPLTLPNIYAMNFMGGSKGGKKFLEAALDQKRSKEKFSKMFPKEYPSNNDWIKESDSVGAVYEKLKTSMRRSGGDITKDFTKFMDTPEPKDPGLVAQIEKRSAETVGKIDKELERLRAIMTGKKPPQEVKVPPAKVDKKAAAKNTIKVLSAQRARNKTRRD